jgi:hypothetical protein
MHRATRYFRTNFQSPNRNILRNMRNNVRDTRKDFALVVKRYAVVHFGPIRLIKGPGLRLVAHSNRSKG